MKDIDIRKCLDGRVAAGALSREMAEEALATITALQRRYAAEMAPDQALAAAQAEAARLMKEAAERRRFQTQRQILAQDAALRNATAHPDGAAVGAVAMLVRDPWDKAPYGNVATRAETILGRLMSEVEEGLSAFRSKAAGLIGQDKAGLRAVVRELFGETTGDGVASRMAAGWRRATDGAVDLYRRAGGDIAPREDWRLPQASDAERMRSAGRDAWTAHMTDAQRRGDLALIDFATGERLAPGDVQVQAILAKAWDSLTDRMPPSPGSGSGRAERRVFHWQTADAWLAYNDRFGVGNDLYGLLVGHLDGMAKDIALTEILGPRHGATVRALMDAAARDTPDGVSPLDMFRGAKAVERTYAQLTGAANAPYNESFAALMGGLRSWLTAAKLGSALVSAVPGDTVTALWAAKSAGIPAVKLLGSVLRQLNPLNAADRRFAARMGIVASSVHDAAIGSKRFADEVVGRNLMGRMADFVVRASGLSAWTNGLRNAFMLEFMGTLADNAGRSLAEVSKPLRRTLKRYGIDGAAWDAIRATPLVEHDGARFLDPGSVVDRELGDRLMGMMIQERAFAVMEPDALVRGAVTFGTQRGTLLGDAARSTAQFKSFSVTMMTTHMMRAATQEGIGSKLGYAAGLTALLTLAGAVTIQARAILTGKDPRRMDDPGFWGAAALQGGGAGIMGDFLGAGFDRRGNSIVATAAGPIGSLTEDVARLTLGNVRGAYEGRPTKLSSEIARFTRANLPGANLWYTRLVLDRALWDQVQTLADPDWRRSFLNMERKARQDYGQRFWWRPGDAGPERAPDLGAALPP